nr:MAG TPA: hypothetical protein [Caudoviricetes sp.]
MGKSCKAVRLVRGASYTPIYIIRGVGWRCPGYPSLFPTLFPGVSAD